MTCKCLESEEALLKLFPLGFHPISTLPSASIFEYLREAADLLKVGEEKKACIKQKIAGIYGVEASTSILKIFQEKNVDFKQIEIAKRNLQRWEKLKNICN